MHFFVPAALKKLQTADFFPSFFQCFSYSNQSSLRSSTASYSKRRRVQSLQRSRSTRDNLNFPEDWSFVERYTRHRGSKSKVTRLEISLVRCSLGWDNPLSKALKLWLPHWSYMTGHSFSCDNTVVIGNRSAWTSSNCNNYMKIDN